MIPAAAVEAAARALCEMERGDAHWRQFDDLPAEHIEEWREQAQVALEAAAPHMAAQTLTDAVDAFPLETISAPDNAVVWLMRRAEELRPTP